MYLPVSGGREALVLGPQDLSDVDAIRYILKSEKSPVRTWLEFAEAYLGDDQVDAYQRLLGDVREASRGARHDDPELFHRIQALCSLAAFHVQRAEAAAAPEDRCDLGKLAGDMLREAALLVPQEALVHLGLGQFSLSKVRLATWPHQPHCFQCMDIFSAPLGTEKTKESHMPLFHCRAIPQPRGESLTSPLVSKSTAGGASRGL